MIVQRSPLTVLVPVNGAELEVIMAGTGEPVVLIQTALLAEEFAPLAREPALCDRYRLIRYHRRGYAGSSAVQGPGSIERDAADCQALITSLGIERAHMVGLSFSCAIALRLAVDAPEVVHTLTLVEPPPMHTPSEPQFRIACAALIDDYHLRGPADAVDAFLTRVIGPAWRTAAATTVPAIPEQLNHDMATFVETDIPALLDWRFGSRDAGRITQPVLHVGGTDSGPWFAESRELMLELMPHAEEARLPGADHSLATTHPHEIATALTAFLYSHPIKRGSIKGPAGYHPGTP